MPDSTSDLPLFHEHGESENSSSRLSGSGLKIPTSFQLLDISEDNKFLALIDDNFMLQVYELNDFGNQLTAKRKTMTDIPCEIKCKNSIFVYISVASGTGHVAISFLQTDKNGDPFENSSKFDQFTKFEIHRTNDNKEEQEEQYCNEEGKETLDNNYSTCRIYRENQGVILEKPFQGRAAFTKNRLVLIGQWTLDVYDADGLNKMYFFKPGGFYLNKRSYQGRNWYRGYFLQDEYAKLPNAGYGLVGISEHVRNNVIVVYEECTSLSRRGSVKIWSVSTGSMICSFMRSSFEYVVSISEDHPFLVTNSHAANALNIYCMKSGTQLCTYESQGIRVPPFQSKVILVKLIAYQSYVLIVGSTVKKRGEPGRLFFEIFSIEQQMKARYVETSTVVSQNSMLALGIFENEDFLNSRSRFYGVFVERTDNNDRHLNFRTIPLKLHTVDSTSKGLIQNRLWDTFTCTSGAALNFKVLGGKSFLLNSFYGEKYKIYLLENDINRYLLLISPYIVQLYRLPATDNDDNTPCEIMHYDFFNSDLVYTGSYYGLKYKDSTSGDIPKLISECRDQYDKPRVFFQGNKGHIFVHVQSNAGNSFSEEVILPLSILKTKTTPGSNDTADNVPEYDFYYIESCLLTLLRIYCLEGYLNYRVCTIDSAIIRKSEELFQSMLSSSDTAAYFQLMSASKILMKLAYSDRGLELIMDIVLQKGFLIAIHNFPTGESENLLTVLIQRKKLDLFQILFNQAILNYHNGDSVDLFPLMDAILYLEKNQLPGLLIKCMDMLSYLPANLERVGLTEREYNTLGDAKSFNNFTAFRQMKKHHSVLSTLLQPNQSNVKGTPIIDPEIYFDSNQVCLIPLPTPRVYKAISYAILTKNSSYSNPQVLNNTAYQEIPIVEVLLTHKWRNFIKGPFYIILSTQILFYIFYTVAVSFPEEIFGYTPGSPIQHTGHLVCLIITLLMWILFFLQEMKQMVALKREYWKSLYNYIDLLAGIFPLVTFILLATGSPHLYDISSLTTLILCSHFLFRLRVNRNMGILIEIIIQLGVKIAPILGLMIFLIISFTFSFVVLLRRQDDSFFQEQFEGNVASDSENNLESNAVMSDQSQQNLFKDPFLAFTTVWFFLYGIFDPILSGDVGNYPMVLVLAILFSFMTALVILNVVIALMTGAIGETEKKGNRNWHIHLADISNEAESLLGWLIKEESATYVYYHARRSTIELQHEKVKNENKKLKEKLLKKRDIERKKKIVKYAVSIVRAVNQNVFPTMEHLRAVTPFKGKLNSTGSLILLLKTIQFKNMTTCHIYEAGITFTVEEPRTMKAVIFLKKPMFEYFQREDVDIPQFTVGLQKLIDCLHLISPIVQTGSVPVDSSCEIKYEEGQLELANPDRERGRLLRSKLSTLEPEEEDFSLNFTQEGQTQKMVMKSEWFITALNDLDDSFQTITFMFSPMDPSFRMQAIGEDNIVEMDYPENSEPFVRFVCDREVKMSYSYSNIMLCKKALDHSSEVSFEVSDNGVLCLLFQIEEKNELLHVSFTVSLAAIRR